VHNLGQTRSSNKPDHLLLTPDTFIRTALPGMANAVAIVHASPAIGADFACYTAEFAANGELGPTTAQRFVYVLSGGLHVRVDGKDHHLPPSGYAYLPQGCVHRVFADAKAAAWVIEKYYLPDATAAAPNAIIGAENELASAALNNDAALQVRCMLPDDSSHDFAVNTMTYLPGASLGLVEMHVMEHGLLMLEGGGIYRLGDCWYPVAAGDFIWMGPWCPQWFGALGKVPAKYIIYKDWNRHPLASAKR